MKALAAVYGAIGVLLVNVFWIVMLVLAGTALAGFVPWLYVASLFCFGGYMAHRLPRMEWYVWAGAFAVSFVWLLLEAGEPVPRLAEVRDAMIVSGCVLFGSFVYTVAFPARRLHK